MNRLSRGIRRAVGLDKGAGRAPRRGSDAAAAPQANAPGAGAGAVRDDSSGALSWEDVFGDAKSQERVDAETAMKISAFYRAVDLRSDSIGKYPISVQNLVTRREQLGHHLGPLLWERPNEAMTPQTFKKLVEYQRLVLGNAYVWIYRDRSGRPAELLPLPPGTCEPYVEPTTARLWYVATDPKTQRLYKLRPEDILHFKGASDDGIAGISLLSYASRTLLVAQHREEYESSVYSNGGRPAGILYTDTDLSGKRELLLKDGTKLSPKDVIRREWDRIHAGPGNAFRTAVLDNGLKYQAISMSNVEAQFIESKTISVEDIARFCGVPLHKLYAGKQSYNSNEANSLDYVVDSITPVVVQYEEEYSYKLLTASERHEDRLWISINMMAELRADSAARGEWYKKMIEAGVFSVNDVRRLEDEPDIAGGDVHFASLNYVPLEDFRELSEKRAERGQN